MGIPNLQRGLPHLHGICLPACELKIRVCGKRKTFDAMRQGANSIFPACEKENS
jgi:hypothetical protein